MPAKPSILCVDSDPAGLQAMVSALQEGFQVRAVHSVEEAEAAVSAGSFEVVCASQRIAGFQGIELLRNLAQVDSRMERVLITGAKSLFARRGDVADTSGVCVVFRPYKPDQLRDVVERLAGVARSKAAQS